MTGSLQPANSERPRGVGAFAQTVLFLCIAAMAGLVFWGHKQTLTHFAAGTGVVLPFGEDVRVESGTGGTALPHRLEDGMTVAKGQILFRIETVKEVSVRHRIPKATDSLRASIARLEAEAADAERVGFPSEIEKSAAAERERRLFADRRAARDRTIQSVRGQIAQTRQAIAEARAKAEQAGRARELAQKELDLLAPLVERGISPKLEFLRVEQRIEELKAERSQAELAVPRHEARIGALERNIADAIAAYRSDAARQLAEARAKAAQARQPKVTRKRERVVTDVAAPVDGVLRQLRVPREGSAVVPGQGLASVQLPVQNIAIDARIDGRIRQGATVTVFRDRYERHAAVRATVDPASSAGQVDGSPVRLRIAAQTPHFETVRVANLPVRIEVQTELPVFAYLLEQFAGARKGQLPAFLANYIDQ